MNNIIECPYCYAGNDITDINNKDHASYSCFECEEEIWECIPSKLLVYESFYFILNVFIYSTIIFISAQFFITYPEWRNASGFVLITSIILASITLHEFFHAFFAFIFGDFSIYRNKYLRLNILNYIHNANSIFLPAIFFVFTGVFFIGAAVYIHTVHIRSAAFRSFVFLSGVVSQLIFLTIILLIINNDNYKVSDEYLPILHVTAGIQIILLIINLLPIPGLDGWNAIFQYPPLEKLNNFLSTYSNFLIVIFFISFVIFDDFSKLFWTPIFEFMSMTGIDLDLFLEGFQYVKLIELETLELIGKRIMNLFLMTWKQFSP